MCDHDTDAVRGQFSVEERGKGRDRALSLSSCLCPSAASSLINAPALSLLGAGQGMLSCCSMLSGFTGRTAAVAAARKRKASDEQAQTSKTYDVDVPSTYHGKSLTENSPHSVPLSQIL